jgi:hydroxyethylthiazole kinase-like uncharacterized protein yjeF
MEINSSLIPKEILSDFHGCKQLDLHTIQEMQIDGKVLMGMAAVSIFEKYRKKCKRKKLIVFCGSGNNGGDGFAIAHLFYNQGEDVTIFYKSGTHTLEYQFYKELCVQSKIEIFPIEEFKNKKHLYLHLETILIDCLLGIGFKTPIQSEIQKIFAEINEFKSKCIHCKILSVDTVSGYEVGKGLPICTDWLAEIGVKKIENQFASIHLQKITFHPIGFPISQFFSRRSDINRYYTIPKLSIAEIKKSVKRKKDSHKFKNGVCGFIGGSDSMNGAILLSLFAFHSLGGGYSKLYTSTSTKNLVLQMNPSFLAVDFSLLSPSDSFWNKANAIVIGPGLKTEDLSQEIEFLWKLDKWIVLDAGGLELAPKHSLNPKVLLTPHRGEFLRFLSYTPLNELDLIEELKKISKRWNVNILLKGPVSILATNQETYIFNSPNPNLSTMGTGDLLSGMIGFFLAKTNNLILAVTYALNTLHVTQEKKDLRLTAHELLKWIQRRI